LAYRKACRHKKGKTETAEWMYGCEANLFQLQAELLGNTYMPGPYRYFTIHEPKERLISVAAFRDRVVHHALVNIIEPFFEATFIKDSYATRRDKGLHNAVNAVQAYCRSYSYFMKLDISQYFASIDHAVLLDLISRKIKDPQVIGLIRIILKNQTESMNMVEEKGLPVGNLTSQFFANIYLNQLDHYLKQQLRYPGYVRYMDDFVLFAANPSLLRNDLPLIRGFLHERLKLSIKERAIQINHVGQGIPFLGYRVFPALKRVRRENLKRCLNGMKKMEKSYILGRSDAHTLYQSTRSRMGFIGFGNTNHMQQSIWGKGRQAAPTG